MEQETEKKSKSERDEETEKQDFVLNYNRESTIGYLNRKMPYHFMIYKRILSEVKQRTTLKPEAILDYGAGLGSGLWAA